MIVAHEFGVSPHAVSTWTYQEFLDALQLVAEQRVGTVARRQRAEEEQGWSALRGELA